MTKYTFSETPSGHFVCDQQPSLRIIPWTNAGGVSQRLAVFYGRTLLSYASTLQGAKRIALEVFTTFDVVTQFGDVEETFRTRKDAQRYVKSSKFWDSVDRRIVARIR